MAKAVEGICKLCGQKKVLTFEHVPPESAFNDAPVRVFSSDAVIKMMAGADGRMPWDYSGLDWKMNQRGGGGYYLCSECNSNTGSWYISEYVRLANTFHEIIGRNQMKPGSSCSVQLIDVYPQRILKAIMTMYCDINHGCMGNERVRAYLLDKYSTDFDAERYKVYLYLASPSMRRISGIAGMFISGIGNVMTSEIGSYPIGTILCIDAPDSFVPMGLPITDFAKFGFDEKCNIEFVGLPYLEINSLFPADFRSEEDFLELKD